jgi:hypothetical protein
MTAIECDLGRRACFQGSGGQCGAARSRAAVARSCDRRPNSITTLPDQARSDHSYTSTRPKLRDKNPATSIPRSDNGWPSRSPVRSTRTFLQSPIPPSKPRAKHPTLRSACTTSSHVPLLEIFPPLPKNVGWRVLGPKRHRWTCIIDCS